MNERKRWHRWALAVVLVVVVMGPGVWVLMQRVPNRIDRALADDGAGHPSVTVEIATSEGPAVHTLTRLWRSGAGDLARADCLAFVLARYF